MNSLSQALDDYLSLRHRLGHELADAARLLPRFVSWMEQAGLSTITVTVALTWAEQPDCAPGSTVGPRRMIAVRGFARYLTGLDPHTEVPPVGLLPFRKRWRPPFIYTPTDIDLLLGAARRHPSPRCAATYETFFGLLATTGMRVGEAIRLDLSDLNWDDAVIHIRESKFGKSRLVPVHPSTMARLKAYTDQRGLYRPRRGNDSLFVSRTRKRLIYESVDEVFRRLRTASGIGTGSNTKPRIHDLRHTFAVATLLDWYRDGSDVASRIQWLSTYLGHHDPRSTYWYLSAAPQLLAVAAQRLEPVLARSVPR